MTALPSRFFKEWRDKLRCKILSTRSFFKETISIVSFRALKERLQSLANESEAWQDDIEYVPAPADEPELMTKAVSEYRFYATSRAKQQFAYAIEMRTGSDYYRLWRMMLNAISKEPGPSEKEQAIHEWYYAKFPEPLARNHTHKARLKTYLMEQVYGKGKSDAEMEHLSNAWQENQKICGALYALEAAFGPGVFVFVRADHRTP